MAAATIASAVLAESPAPSPVVKVCVNGAGKIQTADVVESSTYPEIDAAALEVARAAKFNPPPGAKKGKPGCVKFRVKFVLKDGEFVPEGT